MKLFIKLNLTLGTVLVASALLWVLLITSGSALLARFSIEAGDHHHTPAQSGGKGNPLPAKSEFKNFWQMQCMAWVKTAPVESLWSSRAQHN